MITSMLLYFLCLFGYVFMGFVVAGVNRRIAGPHRSLAEIEAEQFLFGWVWPLGVFVGICFGIFLCLVTVYDRIGGVDD